MPIVDTIGLGMAMSVWGLSEMLTVSLWAASQTTIDRMCSLRVTTAPPLAGMGDRPLRSLWRKRAASDVFGPELWRRRTCPRDAVSARDGLA